MFSLIHVFQNNGFCKNRSLLNKFSEAGLVLIERHFCPGIFKVIFFICKWIASPLLLMQVVRVRMESDFSGHVFSLFLTVFTFAILY